MSSLIQEIQQGALKSELPIDDLLRMVKFAAAKLDLEIIKNWVEQELNGYSGEVPDYRKIYGRPYAWNRYNGWIPIMFEDDKMIDLLSKVEVKQSIGSLQEMLAMNNDGNYNYNVPSEVVLYLNKRG